MKNLTLKNFALSLFFVGTGTASAFSQTVSDVKAKEEKSAYLQDSRGVIARSPYGLCWRTGYWTPADAIPGCDGELVPPVAKPTAPPIAPAATAPVAQATVTEVPQRCDFAITLSNDQAYAFNRSALSSTAKKQIDNEVIAKLGSCATIEAILVTGHTDRLGNQQYNQKLSEKRADTVATYLKSKGITAQINTLGAGKTQPIKACDNKLPRAKLIACLSPNRRVVIEAHGLTK